MMIHRKRFYSGVKWEDKVAYSRAIKVGNLIEVAGTTAVIDGEVQYPGDVFQQTRFIFERIQNVLDEMGSSLQDVIRTRMYVIDISKWEEIGSVHGTFFKGIDPVSTMVEVTRLIDPDLMIEN